MAGGGFMDHARKVTREHREQKLKRKSQYTKSFLDKGTLKNEPILLHNLNANEVDLVKIQQDCNANRKKEILVFIAALLLTVSLFTAIAFFFI